MSNIRVELNGAGIREFLHSPELLALLKGYADEAAARLGEGYAADKYSAPTRNYAAVYPETREAWVKNLKDNSILKAVFSVGD
jgi:hypothetical protein